MTEYPHSTEAEQAVLGNILLQPDLYEDVDYLTVDDFFLVKHKWLWEVYQTLFDRSEPIEDLTVRIELQTRGQWDEFGGGAYVTDLTNHVNYRSHISVYAEIIRRTAKRRRIIAVAGQIAELAVKSSDTVAEISDQAEALLMKVTQDENSSEDLSLRSYLQEYFDEVERRHELGGLPGIPTGISEYDQMTLGLKRGEMTLCGARPSMGKTSLMVNMAYNIARAGHHILFLSLEMDRQPIADKLMAIDTGMDSRLLSSGTFEQVHWQKFVDGVDQLSGFPFQLKYCPGLTLSALRSLCHRQARRIGLDAVFIDYLGLMRSEHKYNNQNEAVSDLSRGIKTLAGEMKIPIVAASQLNREVRNNKDHRPELWDLRDSGSLEQDADNVFFIHRPDYYVAQDRPGIAEVIFAKQRNGPTGMFNLRFIKNQSRFEGVPQSVIERNGHR